MIMGTMGVTKDATALELSSEGTSGMDIRDL